MTPPFPNSPIPNWYRRAAWNAAWSKRNGVHYVGDEIIIDLTFYLTAYDTFPRETNFEMGTNGQAIASDRGSHSPVNVVAGSPAYSSTHAYGGLSALIPTGSGNTLEWDFLLNTTQEYYRFYVYLTAYPASFTRLVVGQSYALGPGSDGKLRTVSFTPMFTTAIALNQWVRIEGHLDYVAQTHEVKLFNNPDSVTPTETQIQTSTGATQNSLMRLGSNISSWGSDLWIDNVVADASAYPGPYDPDPPIENSVTYTVRDYFGDTVSSGTFEEAHWWFSPDQPTGGWKPGWYRVYLTGPQTDTNFADSYGATNFCVVRDDSHFVAMPPGNTVGATQTASDVVMKGVMGIGTTRLTISNAADPSAGGSLSLSGVTADLARTNTYWVDPGSPYADSARPRYAWVDFPGGAVDMLQVGTGFMFFLCKDETIDGSQVFVEVQNGTNPGTRKVLVSFPNSGTLVETYDNLDPVNQTAISTAINGVSNYIVFYWDTPGTFNTLAQTAIGNDKFEGVSEVVSTCFPLGGTHYEGPSNEPTQTTQSRGFVAHMMRLFAAAVHDGHPDAQAMGPAFVNLDWNDTRGWYDFFNAGGHNYCDAISFHAYNSQTNGDINLGRSTFNAFIGLMKQFGVDLPLWQTESTSAFTSVYRIYHPRRARVYLLQTLLQEQYGVPKEQNNAWYDTSHGFWDFPAWLEMGDGSLNPQCVLYRVLAEETWGKSYASALDFGTPGNNIFIGNLYQGVSGSTLALMATSFIEGASITLSIAGTTSVTVVDGWGVSRSVHLSQGRMQIQMTDIPMYVRLPPGAQAGVYRINDWPPLQGISSFSSAGTTKEIDGVSYPVIANDAFMTNYGAGVGIAPTTWATPPSVTRILFPSSRTVDRVIVWCGPAWQPSGTLVTFDVQTTTDGTNWITRRTIAKPALSFFEFGTDSTNAGCFLETFWDEQWIFDVKLPNPILCTGVRLNVTAASYGGEPLSDSTYGTQFGQGNNVQSYRIQEIGIYGFDSLPDRAGTRVGKGSAW